MLISVMGRDTLSGLSARGTAASMCDDIARARRKTEKGTLGTFGPVSPVFAPVVLCVRVLRAQTWTLWKKKTKSWNRP